MTTFIIRTVVSAVGLWLIASNSGGTIVLKSETSALVAAVVLGLANAVVRPILYGIAASATCALSCLTLGLWSLALSLLINGLMFYLVAGLNLGLQVKGFWPAFWGALVLSCVNSLVSALLPDKKHQRDAAR